MRCSFSPLQLTASLRINHHLWPVYLDEDDDKSKWLPASTPTPTKTREDGTKRVHVYQDQQAGDGGHEVVATAGGRPTTG